MMRITVVDRTSPRDALLIVLGCLLAVAAIVVGMHYLQPYLDERTREMMQRKQAIEDAARSQQALDGEDEADHQSVKAPIPPQQ